MEIKELLFVLVFFTSISAEAATPVSERSGTITISGPINLPDGSKWDCTTYDYYEAHLRTYCIEPIIGYVYDSDLPLTQNTWNNYKKEKTIEDEQAACACSKKTEDGIWTTGSGIVCTGAFSPAVLRHLKKDPCIGDWVK